MAEFFELSQTSAGRQRALELIKRQSGPVYETDPADPGVILERLPNGSVRRGKFVNRQFVPQPRAKRGSRR